MKKWSLYTLLIVILVTTVVPSMTYAKESFPTQFETGNSVVSSVYNETLGVGGILQPSGGTFTPTELEGIKTNYSVEMLQLASFYYPTLSALLRTSELDTVLRWTNEEVSSKVASLSSEEQRIMAQYTPAVINIMKAKTEIRVPNSSGQGISVVQSSVYGKGLESKSTVTGSVYKANLTNTTQIDDATYRKPIEPVVYKTTTDGSIDMIHRTSTQQDADVSLPGLHGLDLNLVRSYNSISAQTTYLRSIYSGSGPVISCTESGPSFFDPVYNEEDPTTDCGVMREQDDLYAGIRQNAIATGWTLNIPTITQSTKPVFEHQIHPQLGYGFYNARGYDIVTTITLEDGQVYQFKGGSNKPFNVVDENVTLNWSFDHSYYYLVVDDSITYTFYYNRLGSSTYQLASNGIVSKSNPYGDVIRYTRGDLWYDGHSSYVSGKLIISDTVGRKVTIEMDSSGMKSILVQDPAGNQTHHIRYDRTLVYNDEYVRVYGYVRLDKVVDVQSSRTLKSYTYYDPNEWMADATNEDDIKYSVNATGQPILDVTVNGQPVENSLVDQKKNQVFATINYLLLKEVNDDIGFKTTYTYQAYDPNWNTYGSFEERSRKRGTVRSFRDAFNVLYTGYHPVVNVYYDYQAQDGTQKRLSRTLSGKADQAPEIWAYPKTSGVQGNFHLSQAGSYRDGSQPATIIQTNYDGFSETETTEYFTTTLESMAKRYTAITKSASPTPIQVAENNQQYRVTDTEVVSYQYDPGQTRPYLIKQWVDGGTSDPKPPGIADFLRYGNNRNLPANVNNYATLTKAEYDTYGYVVYQEDAKGNKTENQYGGPYHALTYTKTTASDGSLVAEKVLEYMPLTRSYSCYNEDTMQTETCTLTYYDVYKITNTSTYRDAASGAFKTDTVVEEYLNYDPTRSVPTTVKVTTSGSQYGLQPTVTEKTLAYDSKGLHVVGSSSQVTLSVGQPQQTSTAGYQYNNRDQLTKRTYPDNSYVEYRYDHKNRPVEETFTPVGGAVRKTTILYDDLNRKITTISPDGEHVATTYTPYGEIEKQQKFYDPYVYKASTGFSSTQGNYQWSYMYKHTVTDEDGQTLYEVFAPLQWDASSPKQWDASTATAWGVAYRTITATTQQTNDTTTSRRWTAPYAGTIQISGNVTLKNNGPVSIFVIKNIAPQFNWPPAGVSGLSIGANDFTPKPMVQQMSVNAGDTIDFTLSGNGTVEWDPEINYVDKQPVTSEVRTTQVQTYDSTGTLKIQTLPYGQNSLKTEFAYGPYGLYRTTNALGQVTQMYYANTATKADNSTSWRQLTTRSIEPDGREIWTYKDRFGRDEKIVEKSPTKTRTTTLGYNSLDQMIEKQVTSQGTTQTTRYGYDGAGNLTFVQDDLDQKFTYAYNGQGKLIAQYTNGVQQKGVSYNEIGWPLIKTDAAGVQERYTYKANGLIQTYTDKAVQTYHYTYTPYYEEDRTSVTNSAGTELYWKQQTYDAGTRLLTGMSSSENETVNYHYDVWKRLDAQVAAGKTYGFTYDAFDRLQQLTFPDQLKTTYTYDNVNRMKTVAYPGMGTVEYDYTIATNENKYEIRYPNNQKQEKRTDAFKELTSQKHVQGSELWNESFTYDGMGNIAAITRNGSSLTYQYDGVNRIKAESGAQGSRSYTYDDRGNRLSLQSDPALNFGANQQFAYNAVNQLKTFSDDTGTHASYTYYGDGLRASKTVNGILTRFVYLNGKVIEELDASGNVKARNIWGNELLWRQDNTTAKAGYYFYNGHGDVVAIKDAAGTPINTYDYDIWGNVLSKIEGMNNPYRYTGEPQDDESGMIYLRARYYDPTLGRFINKDTYEGDIANPLSLNLYTYVSNNPLRYVDPSGHIMEGDEYLGLSDVDASLLYSYTSQFRTAEIVNDKKAMQYFHDSANAVRAKYTSDISRSVFYGEADHLDPIAESLTYVGKGLADSLGANTPNIGDPQYISGTAAGIAYGSGFVAGFVTPGPGGKMKTMYHATTKEAAASIIGTGMLGGSTLEAQKVFAFNRKPTLKEAIDAGARHETLIEFQVHVNRFGVKDTGVTGALYEIAEVESRGPVFITNAREVGFRKVWNDPSTWFK
ncbi:RHS repeat domain-containing protein [Paenibacillus ginsengarvi]|uniref:Teneurin-like YD-shell domain-containing protein n=1 Tax=Paenibacillus ginsengarvi TaxID=400777 RepID=A0A3B0BHM4_9BACL|nr:RHS repeat-associated core domain-containing protein [Paenibacillus ginsengarvi]RKN71861.1 hypothetical protein D7M11_28950 [Paenibacillus ginsengarvi]